MEAADGGELSCCSSSTTFCRLRAGYGMGHYRLLEILFVPDIVGQASSESRETFYR
jgi:hypothetical protein